jgi:hypothetical protein
MALPERLDSSSTQRATAAEGLQRLTPPVKIWFSRDASITSRECCTPLGWGDLRKEGRVAVGGRPACQHAGLQALPCNAHAASVAAAGGVLENASVDAVQPLRDDI